MPRKKEPPADKDVQFAARVLKALGNPTRFRIAWHLLYQGEHSVSALVEKLDLPQPIVSQQLAVLRRYGIVRFRPEGGLRHYSIAMPHLKKLFECMHDCCSTGHSAGPLLP